MHTSEIAIARPPELRKVGIHFENRLHVMDTAVNIYRDLGFDLEVANTTIYLECPRPVAAFLMGMIERYTGRIAFNDWEKA
jgi:hypothetical protein